MLILSTVHWQSWLLSHRCQRPPPELLLTVTSHVWWLDASKVSSFVAMFIEYLLRLPPSTGARQISIIFWPQFSKSCEVEVSLGSPPVTDDLLTSGWTENLCYGIWFLAISLVAGIYIRCFFVPSFGVSRSSMEEVWQPSDLTWRASASSSDTFHGNVYWFIGG